MKIMHFDPEFSLSGGKTRRYDDIGRYCWGSHTYTYIYIYIYI